MSGLVRSVGGDATTGKSDDYRDEPTEPEEDREPEPEAPGLFRRVIERLARRPDPRR